MENKEGPISSVPQNSKDQVIEDLRKAVDQFEVGVPKVNISGYGSLDAIEANSLLDLLTREPKAEKSQTDPELPVSTRASRLKAPKQSTPYLYHVPAPLRQDVSSVDQKLNEQGIGAGREMVAPRGRGR